MRERPDPPVPLRPWKLPDGDVYCARLLTLPTNPDEPIHHRPCCNVAQQVWLWPDIGYEWCGDPKGTTTLALNILNAFMEADPWTEIKDWCNPLFTRALAYQLCYGLALALPCWLCHWGGVIHGRRIKEWIVRAQADADRGAGVQLAHRYPHEVWPV